MKQPKQSFTSTNIKYLLTLNRLHQGDRGVRCVDVAESLKLSKPTVHAMINTLKNQNLVYKDEAGAVYFTEKGAALAGLYSNCLTVVRSYLDGVLPRDVDRTAAACALLAEVPVAAMEEMCGRMANAVRVEPCRKE